MSGSSGGYIPSFKNSSDVDCHDLMFTTSLSSPDPLVIGGLKVGDKLEIVKNPPKSIEVLNLDGEVAGALLSTYNFRLLECMDKGVEFEGTVTSVLGANCKILIKAK